MFSILKSSQLYKILILLTAAVFTYSVFDFFQYQQSRTKYSEVLGKEKNQEVRLILDEYIQGFERITKDLAQKVASTTLTEDELVSLIIESSHVSEVGLGVTIAFEPYKFNDSLLFARYFDKNQNKVIKLEELYNYQEKGVSTSAWYTNVISKKEAVWSAPYYAKGAKQLVADYGIPIYKKNSKGIDEVIGMVSYTLSLESLSKFVNKISLGASGFGYIATRDLELVTHPNLSYLIHPELVKEVVKKEPKFERFKTEKEGHFRIFSNYTFEESDIYFSTLKNDWIISVVFNSVDLMGPAHELDDKIIGMSFWMSLMLLFVLMVVFKIHKRKTENLWSFSIGVSILLLFNIILIWFVNIEMKSSREDINHYKITNKTALDNFLVGRNDELKKIGYPKSLEIPTGIYVNNVTFKNAYEVAFGGKVWQKFNDSIEILHDENFVFPQKSSSGISVRTSVVSKTHIDDYWLYRYNFTATLKFDFDYTKYPLDFRLLNFELMYPDIHDNRILIPDLDGYRLLNPGNKPGIQSDIYIPEANLTSSYYSFSERDFNSNLGNIAYNGPTQAPVLVYNMLIKRKIINPVISNILPIFVIAILIFLLLFTITKKDGELKEGNALSVIQASGGFFFVLLLSHIQLRRSLLTPDLSYLESFYFVMYGVIAFVSAGILLYVKTDSYKWLEYKNNLIVKLLYWPILLFIIYLISVIMFY